MMKGTPLLLLRLLYFLLFLQCYRDSPFPGGIVDAFSPLRVPVISTSSGNHQHNTIIISRTTVTTTSLFGLRTKAKEKIASLLTRKPPRVIKRSWQGDVAIEQPAGDDLALQRKSPSSAASIASVEIAPPQNDDHGEQVKKNILTTDGVVACPERSNGAAEMQQLDEDDLAGDRVLTHLPSKAMSLVHLPPLSPDQQEQLTRAQVEFRNHFASFERYSQRDVALLKSHRLRLVLQGMAATPLEPAVYRSLEILYQDLLPLRLAGRFIFRRLAQVMEMCVQARKDELQELLLLSNTTTTSSSSNNLLLSMSTLEMAQLAFAEWVTKLCCCGDGKEGNVDQNGDMENDQEHDLVLPTLRLLQSPSCARVLNDSLSGIIKSSSKEGIQHLAVLLDPQETGTINLPQFVHGLQQWCHENDQTLDDAALHQVSRNILLAVSSAAAAQQGNRDDSHGTTSLRVLDPARQTYSDRFDEMLAAIREWQKTWFLNDTWAPSNNNNGHGHDDDDGTSSKTSKRWQVLKGCCVGAENEAVREALRICYVDNAASRISGNIIFALVSALIPKQKQS
jgi:hypothetical protein